MAGAFFLDGAGVYRCAEFEIFDWQVHGFGTRHAAPVADITLRQIHSANVLNAADLKDREAEGDALIVNVPGKAIGVRTADCVPILLLDRRVRVVAAVHAGWRGTAAGIAEETLRHMRSEFSCDPEDIHVAVGPCIRACCYQVGPEVADRFREWNAVRPGSHVDLAAANRLQLLASGVPNEHIFDSSLCTFCDPNAFHSFRRNPNDPGRMISAICRRV